jgi:flagellar assembly factor FliW
VSATDSAHKAAAPVTLIIDHPEGAIEVPETAMIHLAEPLLGFSAQHRYVLLAGPRSGLWWFISIEQPTVTFVLADPEKVKPGFYVELSEVDLRALATSDPDSTLALVFLTLPMGDGLPATANLRAPLVINTVTRRGLQILGTEDCGPLQQPVALASFPALELDTNF